MPRRVSLPGAAELFRTTPAAGPAGQRDNGRSADDQTTPDDETTPDDQTGTDGRGRTETAAERVEHSAGQHDQHLPVAHAGAENASHVDVDPEPVSSQTAAEAAVHGSAAAAARSPISPEQDSGRPSGTGRVRHDEKITVYVSNDELIDLERARLSLRAEHRMAVDRGRIVRAALALALGDLAEHGGDSELVRRLSKP